MKTLFATIVAFVAVATSLAPTAEAVVVVRRQNLGHRQAIVVRQPVVRQPLIIRQPIIRQRFVAPVVVQPQAFVAPIYQQPIVQQYVAPQAFVQAYSAPVVQSFNYSAAFTAPSVQAYSLPIQSNGCAAFFSY